MFRKSGCHSIPLAEGGAVDFRLAAAFTGIEETCRLPPPQISPPGAVPQLPDDERAAMNNENDAPMSEEPQSARGAPGSRDAGSSEPGGVLSTVLLARLTTRKQSRERKKRRRHPPTNLRRTTCPTIRGTPKGSTRFSLPNGRELDRSEHGRGRPACH